MAQKPISRAAAERMNLVAQDEIWKYRLKAENEARQNWAPNWGFLTTPLEEPKIELPERFRIRPVTPVEKYIKVSKVLLSTCFAKRADPDASVDTPRAAVARGASTPCLSIPVPKTTQGFIGWRSGVPGLNKWLEHDYEIRSCKGAYAKELNWPKQGVH
ncbi:hypothetical protein E2I00_012446 [Balaenoptera physalus]|uniref:Uncharacterized protein n=1 Tax=Balaenoptera physalus TaxID=9770 RepID=A0A643CJH1_BALPH|nr:hypothetical protein E2I00_012446 [Balaenoptera physalus]